MSLNRIDIEKKVLKENLCSMCGSCIGVCPVDCISVSDTSDSIKIDHDKCINCNLCAKSCPSIRMVFTKKVEKSQYDNRIGKYEYFFRGFANDKSIRKNGASGGMVTALSSYFLNEHIADGIICASFEDNKGTYKIITETQDLFSCQKSFYIPIPLNKVLREIKNSEKRYVIIGTPCQLQGFEQAIKNLNVKFQVVAKLGLFCGYIQERKSIGYLRKHLGCLDDDWKFVGWRCGNYPGYVVFKNYNTGAEKKMIIYDAHAVAVPFFSLKKCFYCPDGTNEIADIAFGDVHSFGVDENIGILRNLAVEKYLVDALSKGYIYFTRENQCALEKNVMMVTSSKRYLVYEQISLAKKRKKVLPCYEGLPENYNINFVLKCFYRRKAKLIEVFLEKNNREKILSKDTDVVLNSGRYIYQYPSSSKVYKFLTRIVRMVKK